MLRLLAACLVLFPPLPAVAAGPPPAATGLASWYGGRHDGRLTASGEIHRSALRTAAHRHLPFGTMLKVTNLRNGRFSLVRVNDRGPYVRGRLIDLSERAARDLGMMRRGLARVRIEVLAMTQAWLSPAGDFLGSRNGMEDEQQRRRKTGLPKGRVAGPAALAEVTALLGDLPGRRDLLVEHLHRLQDHFGHLSQDHLAALAQLMRLSQAEVMETASFYAHFDVLADGRAAPPPVTVRLCDGPACRMAGAAALAGPLAAALGPRVRLQQVPCVGRCDRAPAATVTATGGAFRLVDRAEPAAVIAAAGTVDRPPPPPSLLPQYRAAGGYRLLEACLAGRLSRESVLEKLQQGGLRGCGGAGFPTARKWRAVLDHPGPRRMVVNADEGEPGTFKDRHYLGSDPHRVLEGMLVAAWVVEAEAVTIYLRDEYPDLRQRLTVELAALDPAGLPPVELRRGAGSYVCGEESAMIESIEGKRGLPRLRPPLVAERGLFGRPTLVNNVETLYWVRDMVERGPAFFQDAGRRGYHGWRSFSVSGRVREPGVKLAPAGISLAELIDEFCGGMPPGHRLQAFLPGGASGGIFAADRADLPLDFGVFEPLGGFLGSAAVIVLSDQDDIRQFIRHLAAFFADESCGQCTPCRNGTAKAVRMLAAERWDWGRLAELAAVMQDASICGLGQAAANCWQTAARQLLGEG